MQNENEISSVDSNNQPVADNIEAISDKDNKTDEVIDEEKEEQYQKAVRFFKSLKCMTPNTDKVKMYKDTAKIFLDLSGYMESEAYAKKCKKNAKKTREEIKKELYEKAVQIKNKAKSQDDYIKASENFRQAKDYEDAQEMALKCDQLKAGMEKKSVHKSVIRYGIVAICIVVVVFCFLAPQVKYLLANAGKTVGLYNPAITLYSKLGNYKESEEKLAQTRYLYGLTLEGKENYVGASKMFSAAGDYKDSEVRNVKAEQQVILKSKVGEMVKVGNCRWTILAKQHNQVLLLKKKAISVEKNVSKEQRKQELEEVKYHGRLENVTWENSAMRKCLNTSFLQSTFSDRERDNIIQTTLKNDDNKVYGTDGGNDTQDSVFLLSIAEAQKYSSVFPKFKTDSWLRSPGKSQESAAFLSQYGTIMDYGYAVNGEAFTVRPVFWYKLK